MPAPAPRSHDGPLPDGSWVEDQPYSVTRTGVASPWAFMVAMTSRTPRNTNCEMRLFWSRKNVDGPVTRQAVSRWTAAASNEPCTPWP